MELNRAYPDGLSRRTARTARSWRRATTVWKAEQAERSQESLANRARKEVEWGAGAARRRARTKAKARIQEAATHPRRARRGHARTAVQGGGHRFRGRRRGGKTKKKVLVATTGARHSTARQGAGRAQPGDHARRPPRPSWDRRQRQDGRFIRSAPGRWSRTAARSSGSRFIRTVLSSRAERTRTSVEPAPALEQDSDP